MEYKVVLESFEGPMDLLLHLIEKAQIDIYDIPINEITEQYIDYLSRMEELDLEITSEFLVMAATLLEIKSKLLLPQINKGHGGQLEMEEADPRLELVKKLVEYKKYKDASMKLRNIEKTQRKVYYKPKEDLSYYVAEEKELEEMDLNKLVQALIKLLSKNRKDIDSISIKEIQEEEYSLEVYIAKIKEEIEKKEEVKFSQLFHINTNKKEIIVTFLSLLELIRLKYVTFYQEENFSDIIIKKSRKGAT
ncbi:MAG: segregation/condensation protein A [Tissierellia bacterium]|nr:segregation/condensation protein A [Tissierellia bacterium]